MLSDMGVFTRKKVGPFKIQKEHPWIELILLNKYMAGEYLQVTTTIGPGKGEFGELYLCEHWTC